MIDKLIYYIFAFFLFFIPILLSMGIIEISNHIYAISNRKNKTNKLLNFFIFIIGIIIFIYNLDNSMSILKIANEMSYTEIDSGTSPVELVENSPLKNNITYLESSNSAPSENLRNLSYYSNFTQCITKTYDSIELNDEAFLPHENDTIAIDLDNNKEVLLNELYEEKILVPYIENGKEIIFYGQYNEKNQWQGTCVFNIYENNVLISLMNAEYEDGVLKSYKKVEQDETRDGIKIWSISERKVETDYNIGETWNYFQVKQYIKEFDIDSVKIEDLIYVENFENNLKTFSVLEGYYNGRTSNGYYNDDTGKAYMIKYSEKGIIRTLYVGMFKNGLPHDQTGKAWQIVLDPSYNINQYFYYMGSFENGERVGKVSGKDYITSEELDEIINEATENGLILDCDLNWYNKTDYTIIVT